MKVMTMLWNGTGMAWCRAFGECAPYLAGSKRISEDAGVKIGGRLFSDAMRTPDKSRMDDLGTYEGMKHNLNTIVNA